jgi:hypothetical protein
MYGPITYGRIQMAIHAENLDMAFVWHHTFSWQFCQQRIGSWPNFVLYSLHRRKSSKKNGSYNSAADSLGSLICRLADIRFQALNPESLLLARIILNIRANT